MCKENCKCRENKNNIYISNPKSNYSGYSLIAAKTVEEANSYIKNFKEKDKGNLQDSKGYSFVDENNKINDVYTERSGIIIYGINYLLS